MFVGVAAIFTVAALYLTGLTTMGMYSTDEPRYAWVGRAMAQSGDWITPRLWSGPWFEKPALLYWMTATGFKLGLGPDLAPRLPVALLSVVFLGCFWLRLRRVFDDRIAGFATLILATTGGWLAYSHVAVTDVPLAAFFSMAVLYSLPPNERGVEPNRVAAAILLALAVLAKSIPPLILFLPVLVMDRKNWRKWLLSWPILTFLAVALPWHLAGIIRNGWQFIYVLFIEQQFGRFFNSSRQHGQPWWFYGPVFLLLLFPWFPLLALAVRHIRESESTKWLAAVTGFGLIFFSASINKLPGYVLPLVPVTCVLMAVGLARATRRERWLIAPIAMLGGLPVAASILPEVAAHRAAQIPWAYGALDLAVAAAVGAAIAFWLRPRAFALTIVLAAGGLLCLEIAVFPVLDQAASARPLWAASHPDCAPVVPRGMPYGLYYYSGKKLPDCAIVDKNAAPLPGNQQRH
jgi:4-amino-4-deoxy-L-arabinose transferase-like glycosyltransferase